MFDEVKYSTTIIACQANKNTTVGASDRSGVFGEISVTVSLIIKTR